MLLGTSGIGKSCLVKRFIDNQFVAEQHHSTKRNLYERTYCYDGQSKKKSQTIKLNILDVDGQRDHLDQMVKHLKPNAGFILLFDINNSHSLSYVTHYRELIMNLCPKKKLENISLILVGTKCDLPNNVSEHNPTEMASNWRVPYVETSAKNGQNVELCFETIVKQIDANQKTKKKTSKRSCCIS